MTGIAFGAGSCRFAGGSESGVAFAGPGVKLAKGAAFAAGSCCFAGGFATDVVAAIELIKC